MSTEINSKWSDRLLYKKLRQMIADCRQYAGVYKDEKQKAEALVDFVFSRLEFHSTSASKPTLQTCLLPYIIESKKAIPELLALIFATFAEAIDLKIQCLSENSCHLIKIYIDERPHILDLCQKGRFLEPYDIVDLVNQGVDFSKSPTPETAMVKYLFVLQSIAREELDLHVLSLTHSHLMRYQPFNLKHLSERAMIAYETGDFRRAVDDIRDYFLYKSPDMSNFQLKQIYKLARKKVKSLEPSL